METSPSGLPSQDGFSISASFVSIFSFTFFAFPYSEEIGLSFYKSGALCQRLEVVLWKSLQVEVIF